MIAGPVSTRRFVVRLPNFQARLPWVLGGVLVVVFACQAMAWQALNGRTDGFQNEILHVGNALDFWGAFVDRDLYHLGHFFETYPWPPGFYAWPWPFFALGGANHKMMVLSNLGHLAVLLGATYGLGACVSRRVGLLAMGIVVVYPSIFGNLVRFEPNVAATAWVTVCALALVRCRSFQSGTGSLVLGALLGVGLWMDRMTVGMFLMVPVGVEALRGLSGPHHKRVLQNGLRAGGLVLVLVGAWYWGFLRNHLPELVEQLPIGEVDSTGRLTEHRDALSATSLLFYPASLLDGQAGLVPGLLGLIAVVGWAATRGSHSRVPGTVVLWGMVLFTIIQKKQVYYTIPMLGCLSVLTATWLCRMRRGGTILSVVLFVAGIHQMGFRMWDRGLPLPSRAAQLLGGEVLADAWVAPRYPQAIAPRDHRWPVQEVAGVLPPGEVLVFSENGDWYEGYLVLSLREQLPGRRIRGVLGDPQGTYEWYRTATSFLYLASDPDVRWPDAARIHRALREEHYQIGELPPVADVLAQQRELFREVGAWPLRGGVTLRAYRRVDSSL